MRAFILLFLTALVSASPQECQIKKLKPELRPVFIEWFEWTEPEVSTERRSTQATFRCKDGFADTTIKESAINVTCSGSDYIYNNLSFKYFDLLCKDPFAGAFIKYVRVPANQMTSPLLHCDSPDWRVYRMIIPYHHSDICFNTVTMFDKYTYEYTPHLERDTYSGPLRWLRSGVPPPPVPPPDNWWPPAAWYMDVFQRNASEAFPVIMVYDDRFAQDMREKGWMCEPFIIPDDKSKRKNFKCNYKDFFTRYDKMEHCVRKNILRL